MYLSCSSFSFPSSRAPFLFFGLYFFLEKGENKKAVQERFSIRIVGRYVKGMGKREKPQGGGWGRFFLSLMTWIKFSPLPKYPQPTVPYPYYFLKSALRSSSQFFGCFAFGLIYKQPQIIGAAQRFPRCSFPSSFFFLERGVLVESVFYSAASYLPCLPYVSSKSSKAPWRERGADFPVG